jgi:3-hydroxyisobutyrate dehydrogenase
MMSTRVGFVGLGLMGSGMAENLLKKGFPLTVWNRTAGRADALCAGGATRAATPAALAAAVDVIVTCVADPPALRAVALGEQGLLAGAAARDGSTAAPSGRRWPKSWRRRPASAASRTSRHR